MYMQDTDEVIFSIDCWFDTIRHLQLTNYYENLDMARNIISKYFPKGK